jgi:hypothetical protein
MFLPLISLGKPSVASRTWLLSAKKPWATWLVPGSSELGGDKDGLFAVVVELEVDGALGEDGALELVERAGDLRVLALADDKAVLKDVAELKVLALYESEELGGTGVHVRGIDAAWLHESESGRDAKAGQDGEGLDVLVYVSR